MKSLYQRIRTEEQRRILKRWIEMRNESLITLKEYAREWGLTEGTFQHWVSEYNKNPNIINKRTTNELHV
jgi:hypothetical protein